MKKNLLLALLLVLAPPDALMRNRVNSASVTSETPIATLQNAVGWMLTPDGHWMGFPNRIPAYLPWKDKSLQNQVEWGIGFDNFIALELFRIEVNGKSCYLLIKKTQGGNYRYERTHQRWISTVDYYYFVFDPDEFQFEASAGATRLNVIKTLYSGKVSGLLDIPSERWNEILGDITRQQKIQTSTKMFFCLNVFYHPKEALIRFLMFSREEDSSFISLGAIASLGKNNVLPGDRMIMTRPEVFERFYYECDLKPFATLFPLIIE